LSQVRRFFLDAPLALIHLVGGIGASVLAFMLTFNGYGTWIAYPIMFVCLMPDSLYSVSLFFEYRRGHSDTKELFSILKFLWLMMACACVAILFAAWLGMRWGMLNAVLGAK